MKEPLFLCKYRLVEKNELPARYRITSSVPVSFKSSILMDMILIRQEMEKAVEIMIS